MKTRFTIGTLLWIATLLAVAISFYMAGYRSGEQERMKLQYAARQYERVVSKPIDIELGVVDAETKKPIKGAKVEMTLVSGWADGGFTAYVTNAEGKFTTSEVLCVGNYQIAIYPPAGSVYVPRTYLYSPSDMLNIKRDGSYSPTTFEVKHKATPNDNGK